MARFEVTVSEMQNAANKISQAAQDFLSNAEKVMQSAQALADSWEGDSQVAFQNEQTQAFNWYKSMVELVNNYVSTLNTTARTYQEADEASAQNIKSR